MKLTITCVDDLLNKAFYKLGYVVGKSPGYFIIIPVLLGCICITGYQRIHYEIDPEYLFSPLDGPGKTERAIVENYFKVNYSHQFNLGRITRPGRFGHVIVVSKDDNPNMLRSQVWDELVQLDKLIRSVSATYDGETFNFEHICARWYDKCSTNDVLELQYLMPDVEKGALNITFPVMFNSRTWNYHLLPVYFGGSVVTIDAAGCDNDTAMFCRILQSVPAVQLGYFVRADTPRQDAFGGAWEEAFLDAVGKAENNGLFKHISVARFASKTMELEFEENTKTIVPYYALTFATMAGFSVITCMMTDWVRSKPWLGLLGNLSAVWATLSAFGFCCYLGVDFIGINLAAPFLMVGIGIDDTFVMLAAWRRTNIMDPVPDRMAKMLSEAAVSVTITSLTDMVSFVIGVFSPFPSVTIFCIYSGVAVFFTFLFHLSFFAGCVAVSGYCEEKNRHSVVCCKVQPLSKSGHRSWLYRLLCTGGIDPADPNNPLDNPEHGCMSWFRDYLATFLSLSLVKVFVIFAFLVYLAGAFYGLSQIQEGLDRRKLSKNDSYSIEFYDREDLYYREFPYRIQVIISGQYDYSDPVILEQAENLTRALEANKYILSEQVFTESWLRKFIEEANNTEITDTAFQDEASFVEAVKDWLSPSRAFVLDVKFDEKEEHIIASRFMIQGVNISGTNQEKEMVKDLRRICAESPLNASVFHPYFVFFDQFELVGPTSIQGMVFGALTMMVISFIFIPNIVCSFWVAFCIISIELGVAGYMALWDVHLDSISMINLIMCIGFSVDFTAHICYAYMSSKEKLSEDRVRECLYSLGLPILQGALSTILGLTALLLARTYIFLVFFKVVFLVIFIGAMHGLILLPVLLSIFGPGSCKNSSGKDRAEKDIAKFQQPYVIPHPTLHYQNGKAPSPIVSLSGLEDRDPGLGTSEDSNSTESGSTESRRRQKEDESNRNRYNDWRRSQTKAKSHLTDADAPPPDYPGAPVAVTDQRPDARNVHHSPERYKVISDANDNKIGRSQQHSLNSQAKRYLPDVTILQLRL